MNQFLSESNLSRKQFDSPPELQASMTLHESQLSMEREACNFFLAKDDNHQNNSLSALAHHVKLNVGE